MAIIANPGGSTGTPGGITYSDVIEKALRRLHSGERENLNQIGYDIPDVPAGAQSTFTLTQGTKGIIQGSIIEIGTEMMYVWNTSTSTGATNVTVQRGYAGSNPVAHTVAETVTVNPKYPRFLIGDAVNDELNSLVGRGLFQMKTVDFTYQTATIGYDLGVNDILDIYDVSYHIPTTFKDWVRINASGYRFEHLQDPSNFATGNVLYLRSGGYPGQPVRVFYKAGFSPLVNLSDDVQAISGLQSEAADILSTGAAIRLMAPEEIARNDLRSQGDTRRPSEVPSGAVLRSYQGLAAERESRISEEKTRLERQWPLRKSGF